MSPAPTGVDAPTRVWSARGAGPQTGHRQGRLGWAVHVEPGRSRSVRQVE